MKNQQENAYAHDVLELYLPEDDDTFEEMCTMYYPKVYRFVLSFLKSEELSKNVVSEICLEIRERSKDISPDIFDTVIIEVSVKHTYGALRTLVCGDTPCDSPYIP